MRQSRFVPVAGWLSLVVLVVLAGSPTLGQAPKYGGGLTLRLREDLPQGFAIHETATISTMWPAMPCFSNLVLFDPLKTTHRMDAIVGELAERWSWQDNDRSLVFFLRTGARWHDGPPASYRAGCVGTGPFRLKEWRKGEFVEYVKNPDNGDGGAPGWPGGHGVPWPDTQADRGTTQEGSAPARDDAGEHERHRSSRRQHQEAALR